LVCAIEGFVRIEKTVSRSEDQLVYVHTAKEASQSIETRPVIHDGILCVVATEAVVPCVELVWVIGSGCFLWVRQVDLL
ncbi:hypothetical protein, partial [Bacteroides thetaiotaomicron]|uniref:hypothetical protein n=1 Tax=Bacteroides thetaiotaomicron TaxID=818 RepID=UPI0015855BDE